MSGTFCVAWGPRLRFADESHGDSFDEAILRVVARHPEAADCGYAPRAARLGDDGQWYKEDGSLHRGDLVEGW